VFNLLQKDIIRNLDKQIKADPKDGYKNKYFDYNYYFNLLSKQTKDPKRKLAIDTIIRLLDEVNLEKSGADYEKEIQKVLKDSGRLDRETLDTIIKDVDEIIKKTKEQGKDLSKQEIIEEATKTINLKFDSVIKQSRVKMIGRTVATYTSESSKREIANKYKFKLMWISQRDGKVRPSHRRLDGKVQNDKGKFNVGGFDTTHPAGEGLPASEAVNCRCVPRGIRN
jgi:superfamily II RNA helicase